jgi:PAS domain S-box-containing protein
MESSTASTIWIRNVALVVARHKPRMRSGHATCYPVDQIDTAWSSSPAMSTPRKAMLRERAESGEGRFSGILRQATVGVAQMDLTGRFIVVNDRYCTIVGRSRRELLQMRMQDITHPEDLVRNLALLERTARTGEDFVIEKRFVRPDGSMVWVQKSVYAVTSPDGIPESVVVIAVDISDRKLAEHELRESRDIIDTVNRVGRTVAAELSLDKVVQTVTDAATQLTRAQFGAFFYNRIDEQGEQYLLYALSGVPREAFADFPMPRNTAIFGPTFRGEGVVRLDDVTKDPRYGQNAPYHGEPPGHLPVVSYLAVPVVSRLGEVHGGLFFGHADAGVFTEYDERVVVGLAAQAAIAIDNARLYEAERKARAEAEAANRAKDEFLSVVSHELRTPLNSMLGWLRVLRMGTGNVTRAIDTIERSVTVQRKLIEDLLDVSRIVAGQLRVDLQPVDLAAAVRGAVDSIRPVAEAKGIHLESAIESLPGLVAGDPERLQQIVSNLLANGVKFTPAGGLVTIRLDHDDAGVRLTVRDTGPGIASDFLPHIFERFRQAASVKNRRTGGLGLGLAITRHLVELHGGTISVDSGGEGKGTTFTVTLPLAPLATFSSQRPSELAAL